MESKINMNLSGHLHKCYDKHLTLKDDEKSHYKTPQTSFLTKLTTLPTEEQVSQVCTNWLMTNIRGWPLVSTLALTLHSTARHSFSRRKSLRDRSLSGRTSLAPTRTSPPQSSGAQLEVDFFKCILS